MPVINQLIIFKYKFLHWFFQWKQDEENDVCFVVANRFVFLKYKEHTIVRCDGNSARYRRADKYLTP